MLPNQINKQPKPEVLKGTDLPSLAEYMKSGRCKKVVFMLGAGVSTAAGIPDFRSPDTGLYANLARLKLPYPEAVFEINFFRRNPVPFYILAHELYPGKFRPTLTHSFIRLLSHKNLLDICFTQNIDTLERRAGIPESKIIEAHGSFASQRCVDCSQEFDGEKMREYIKMKKVPECEICGGYVKPDIVFFGEGLPKSFVQSVLNLRQADLLIVMGTSLTVHPFASLAGMVDSSCPRVLINLERVGNFGSRPDDVVLIGKCDEVVRDLCRELGWEEELDKLWAETKASVLTEPIERPENEGASGVTKVDGEQAEEAKTRTSLETIEAVLAKIYISAEGEKKQRPATKVDAHEPSSTPTVAEKVAKEASSAIKDDVKDQKDESSASKPYGKK